MTSSTPDFPSFDDIQSALSLLGSLGEAAQTHGLLCAFFACGVKLKRQAWINSLFTGNLDKSDPELIKAQEDLTQLFIQTEEAFGQEDFNLKLILPDDEVVLIERIEALAEFSKGFVLGLNLTGIDLKTNSNSVLQEAFDDMLNISCLVPQDEEGEEAERAFIELSEYMRLAMIQIYWELQGDVALNLTPPDETIH